MGVPSFYRWLVGKYPNIVVNAIEVDGDCSEPNPNEMEFDNLYLDMNGIIHPCFHPEDELFPPTTYDDVFNAIFAYIDHIFRIVRPRKLLYMAIDGVAPRAKMNQQRSRRFRTAKEAEVAEEEGEKLRREFERAGKKVLPKEEYEISDSTVITPGTVFMQKLSTALEYYIGLRLSGDPGWNQIKVILSDSNVPGEGEHKIMSFIRLQRDLTGYDPNTRHCLYGLDADLIMLALASHELHFSILREDVLKQHNMFEAILSTRGREGVPTGKKVKRKTPYQFLHIWTLREYLAVDMRISDPPVEFDIERIVDDFIFICFFTGNDFLPHMPSIEIHEGAIDLLIAVYKNLFKKMGGYLVDTKRVKEKKTAYIKLKRVEQFISKIGSYEDNIFEKRYQLCQKKIQRWLRESLKEGNDEDDFNMCESVSSAFANQCSTSEITSEKDDVYRNTMDLKQKLKDLLRDKGDLFKNGVFGNDKVKLGIPGWKARYYSEKFSADNPNQVEGTQKAIVKSYMEGLCWVLQYYFAGVCSWCWYYPYHYGPFASDLKGISGFEIKFNLGFPLKPFDQLMAVLPPRSSYALPKPYQQLMRSEDSVIKKFYPSNFLEDMDGKRFAWQGVVKLPFIEEELLLSATKLHEKELGIDEVQRNMIKNDKILVMKSHSLSSQICYIYATSGHVLEKIENKHCIDPTRVNLNGYLAPCDDHTSMTEDLIISASFINPDYHVHKPVLLENVIEPEKTITEADIVERKLWHEYEGPNPQPSIRQQRYESAGSGWGGRGRGKEPEMLPYTGWHASGGGRGHLTSERGGGRGRMTSERRGKEPEVLPYTGWGGRGRGRGKEPEMIPYTGWHASDGGRGRMTSQRGGGSGSMTSETMHFCRQPDRYPLNENQASQDSYSNFSDAVYCSRNASFQQTINMSSDGRSNNWQWRSTEMATTNTQTPLNKSLDGRSNNLQWGSTEIATSDTGGCGNHAATDGRDCVINMMPNNHYTRGRGNHAATDGRGRGNHAATDERDRVINMMPNNHNSRGRGNHAATDGRGRGNHAATDGRGRVINMMPNNHNTRGRGNHAATDGRGRVINMMPNNHYTRGRGNHAALNGRGRGMDRMPNYSSCISDSNRFSSISGDSNDW